MDPRPPRPDPAAPLLALATGEHERGLWVDPAYLRAGYPEALTELWLRPEVVERLVQVAAGLLGQDLGLLLWDGWRSPELQRRLWEEYRGRLAQTTGLRGEQLDAHARQFVSPPQDRGGVPAHQTGGAVDLTLCTPAGEPLEMGGGFDELSERSHPLHYEREGLSGAEREFRHRRRLLAEAMGSAGFWRLPTEWWHFEYGTPGWAVACGAQPLFEPLPASAW